ncbi:CD109 antigen-like [Chironomus tepperi]|uniref:CD109 antigen-like n=1 Tax=Chironomus tepperi TaxID=113505 RepID=UPI00391EE3F5
MKLLWLFCLIFLNNSVNIDCVEEYVTLWSPKRLYEKKDYNVVVLSNNIDSRTEIALQFRRSVGTIGLTSDKVQKMKIKNNNDSGSKKEFELIMTLHRNGSVSTGTRQMCMTQALNNIEPEKKKYYTFIQTDKPIYKPGDKVRFRVIVVDRDLKPFHMNNININVTDPLNRPIKEFDDLGENFLGVFSESFDLGMNTPLGIWKIRAVIDKMEQWETYKEFAVEKYTLPPFAAYIELKENHLLTNSILKLSFYAKYSFEDFVRGNAQLTITCTTNGQVVVSKTFNDIANIHNVKYKAHEELKAITTTKLDYLAFVVFTDPESGISANKSIKFTVHADNSPKIEANHPAKFMPGLPFGFKVFIYDWTGKLILTSPERVKISLICRLQNGQDKTIMFDGVIKRGVAIVNALLPEDTDDLKVKIQYLMVEYKKTIEKGSVVVGINKIAVDYMPKYPNYGDMINVHIRGDAEIDQLIGIVMSRHGNIESHQIYCNYRINCKFNFTIKGDMMPEAKVVVYYLKDRINMYHGETTITTVELGKNTLDIEMENKTQTKQKVGITMTTKPDSTVYLLGYDKRLTYLFQGNDVKKEDVVKELANYDGTNQVTVFHVNKTNWHECTPAELKRIQKGRITVVQHSGDEFSLNEDEDFEEIIPDLESEAKEEKPPSGDADDIREDFRAVWIFDQHQIYENGTSTAIYQAPDSITSWLISSFSMNEEHGLAIGPPKELIVKNEFFTKVVLPYSIRYKEKLRIDVMVYNYIEKNEALDVTVMLTDFESKKSFRIFDSECSNTPIATDKPTKTVKVPFNNAKRVSFYIQSGNDKAKYEQTMKIRIDANGKTRDGTSYSDKMVKRLRVEPIGVKVYDITSDSFIVRKGHEKVKELSKNVTNGDEYPKFIVEIAGDYLTDDMTKVKLGYEIYPHNCLEQRTSKLKGNVEHFRYLKSKNPNPSTHGFTEYYQSILDQKTKNWNYRGNTGFRAYFIEAIASAMEIGALPKNARVVEQELDALKSKQNADGTFTDFGPTPPSKSAYFQTAYVLVPFLKIRNMKFVTKSYDDVINKCFNYLTGINAVSETDKEAYGLAALAYAINGSETEAERMLNEVEKSIIQIDKKRKCYKITKAENKCHMRHTSYVAISYLTLNRTEEAKKLITWLLGSYRAYSAYEYTYDVAITTEAIAKFLMTLEVHPVTDLTVILTNEMDFKKELTITAKNQKDTQEVIFPHYTLHPMVTFKGTGYSSVTLIVESTVSIEQQGASPFIVTVKPDKSTSNIRTVQICATYSPNEDSRHLQTLVNVIYDVEMPSGYTYTDIVNLDSKPEIKMAHPRKQRTKVQIYYNDFVKGKQYCVDIKATKFFDVKDVQNAGIMIYDFNEKANIAVEFYKFASNC